MSDKYIIRNCPVAFNTRVDGTYCNDVEITTGKNIHCQDCTDCVMKKIVELCKPVKEEYSKHKLDALIAGKFNIAGKILLLLDIQEVE